METDNVRAALSMYSAITAAVAEGKVSAEVGAAKQANIVAFVESALSPSEVAEFHRALGVL